MWVSRSQEILENKKETAEDKQFPSKPSELEDKVLIDTRKETSSDRADDQNQSDKKGKELPFREIN
jgi:hypothetical protein